MSLSKSLLFLGGLASVGTTGLVANADSINYDVQSGDTLSEIAQNNNMDIDKIVSDNNIADPNLIYVGQQLVLNTDGESTQTVDATSTYTDNSSSDSVENTTSYVDQSQYASENVQPVESQSNTYYEQSYQPDQSSQVTQFTVDTGSTQDYSYNSDTSSDEASAKEWIAQRESGGSYTAQNGQYIGRYQLSSSYLNGDYSAENQERVAQQYVTSRYGSWQNAKSFWLQHGWY